MTYSPLADFGPYSILRPIAKGGMAELYLARQRGLEGVERTVVIKRILEKYADDEEFITMFLDEARLLAALSHPNIAQVFEVGRIEGSYYLAMEYVRGPTLGKLMAAAKESGGIMPRREALGVGLAIAEALHYVHERRDEVGRPLNIVHRDLNPANVLVSYDGAVKLIDFGIAKAATKVYETRTGVIKGTYGYIAPEQLAGTTPVDRRADVFALGILLYELCVGQHPYDVSDEPNLIDRILEARYRRPREVRRDIPRDLDRLIASCLTPHPEGRPSDLGEVIDALSRHLGEQGIVPTLSGLAQFARKTVPDDEGPRPLRPLTAHKHRRPFGRDPTGTRKVGLADVAREQPAAAAEESGGRVTAISRPPPAPEKWESAPTFPSTMLDDDEPLTFESEPRPLARGTDALLAIADTDEEPETIARAIDLTSGGARESSMGDDEAPTRLMSLSDTAAEAPREQTPTSSVPPPREPAHYGGASASAAWLAVGAIAVMAAIGLGVFYALKVLEPETVVSAPPGGGTSGAGVSEEPEEPGLEISSDPAGASVWIDGEPAEGRTPLTVELPPGTDAVWVRVSLEGHIEEERRVLAAIGHARFSLEPLAIDAGAPDDAGPAPDAGAPDGGPPARRRRRRRRR